jgi:hypothetical protein
MPYTLVETALRFCMQVQQRADGDEVIFDINGTGE